MITQTITASMTQTHLSKILTRRYDVGREIKFILYKDELLSDPIDLTDYTVVITVIKPDNNFVIENFVGDTVTITEQMEAVTGTGYYCVHVTKDTETIYTGQGEFIIDDVLISDDELESISEVNGLKFPDDFLTIDDHVAVIDDTVTTTEKTWSSSKISDEIENASVIVSKTAEGNPIELTDAADAPLVKCVTAITGYQRGTGTPSPDNIRPITAYTEGEIEVRGSELGGINFMAPAEKKTVTRNGITVTSDGNGRYTIKGTAETSVTILLNCDEYTIPDGSNNAHSFGMMNNATGTCTFYFYNGDTFITDWSFLTVNRVSGYAQMSNKVCNKYGIGVLSGATVDIEFSPMICAGGTGDFPSTFSTYYKYYDHTTTYPSAIYRGSEDCVNGEVVTEWGMIASYAGESLPGEWISDRDEYAPGTTPTTGAQVAYELATPTTSSVTPSNLPIKSISGYAHIESTTGNMEIEYITQEYQPLVESIVMESESNITKLWDAGFTPSPGVWLEYDFGEDLENYDAIVILFVVSGWEGNNADSVTVYPKIQNLNTTKYYHYIKGTDYGIQFWHVSGTTYGLGSIDGNYPPQYKAVYGIKY